MAEKKISAKSEPRSRRRGGPETDSLVQILLNSYKGSDAGLPPELETLKEELQGELDSPRLLNPGKPLDHHSMGLFPRSKKKRTGSLGAEKQILKSTTPYCPATAPG